MRKLKGLRRTRWVVLLAIAATVVVTVAVSQAATGPAIQTITPQYADDVTNVDVLKQQIKNYYGDPLGSGNFAPDSNYAKEAQIVAANGAAVAHAARQPAGRSPEEGDRARRRRHDARDVQLRDLLELGVQPDDECDLRER